MSLPIEGRADDWVTGPHAATSRIAHARLESILSRFARRSFPRGVEILTQGAPVDTVYVVRTGLLKEVRVWSDFRATIVGLRYPHSMIGIEATTLNAPQPASVVTVVPSVLWAVPVAEMRQLERNEIFSRELWRECCLEIRRQRDHVARLAHLSARGRLEDLLRAYSCEMAAVSPGLNGHGVELMLREWELAQLLAITPQYLCRLMHELEASGRLIRTGIRWAYHPAADVLRDSTPTI